MKHISNEEKAIELAENISPYDIGGDNAAHYAAKDAALDAMEWKQQQIIDKAMKVICNGCAQKVECEFKNWKTCTTRDELIKLIEE